MRYRPLVGLFATRWEADYDGQTFVVDRDEVTKGLTVSFGGVVIAKKTWSLIGLGELEGNVRHGESQLPVRVKVGWGGFHGQCAITVAGQDLQVRRVV